MAHRRHVSPPALVCSPRSSLSADSHPAVDGVLKQLKACSRRLQAALSSHRTESQILERLYYKGKNQHRTALFWQRVVEMRRHGERLGEMHMDDVVESLRLSFWGEQSVRTAKILKGPWTHYPNAKVLLFVLERCSACCALIERAKGRLLSAYESLSLVMQTGAFLQSILAIAAIASRMSILLSEVGSALGTSWSSSYTALQILFPTEAEKVTKLVGFASNEPSHTHPLPQSRNLSALPTLRDVPEEDLGSTLARNSDEDVKDKVQTSGTSLTEKPPSPAPDGDVERLDFATFSLSGELKSIGTTEAVTPPLSALASTLPTTSVPKRKKPSGEASKHTKKRRKRDEIDDIFGF